MAAFGGDICRGSDSPNRKSPTMTARVERASAMNQGRSIGVLDGAE